jgi:phosphatidylglycerol:prolipoprotein diacylglycerol transferase
VHPILFTIPVLGGLDIRAYGLAMALGFILNMILMSRRAVRDRIDPDLVLNMAVWIIVGTLVGGRLLFVLTQWEEQFADAPLDALKIWQGGLVFYGGFLGSFVAAILYVQVAAGKRGMPVYDIAAPVVGLGLAIHRTFGCFLNGCCYGSPTTSWIGVRFPLDHHSVKLYGEGVRVHPTQLYEALNGLSMFAILLLWRKFFRKRHGELTGLMFMVYAVNRFFIEFYRGDPVRAFVGIKVAGWELSTSQFIGLLAFPLGLALFLWARFKGEPVGTNDAGAKGSPYLTEAQAKKMMG